MKYLTTILLLIPVFVYSQSINGKLYDEDSTVKGALIINFTQNDTTYTNYEGNFKINAYINDSLVFRSLFHHEKKIKVTASHLKDIVVFELIKKVNALDEVLLVDEKEKSFNIIEYKQDLKLAIAEDIKKNPHLYRPVSTYSNGINFVELAKLIGINKLFKKKKQYIIKPINYKQLDSLFSNSNMFTDMLLTNELNIQKEYKYLFFEYCEAQNLNSDLLLIKENLVLLDSIIKCSHKFLKSFEDEDTLNTSGNK